MIWQIKLCIVPNSEGRTVWRFNLVEVGQIEKLVCWAVLDRLFSISILEGL